jgi:hypothetical protein
MVILSKNVNAGFIVGAVVVIIVATALMLILTRFQPSVTLYLGDGVFNAQVAKDQSAREKGLGGVSKLEPQQALILAFPRDDKWGVWMKDMKVPIDIVWLNKDKKVVHIVKGAQPDDSTSITYTPKSLARYVVELPAGTVDSKSIVTGRAAVFDISTEEVE